MSSTDRLYTQPISVYYADVGEQYMKPRYGSDYHTERRMVKDIQDIEGGQRGVIRYNGKDIPVWRRNTSLTWETRESALNAPKATYL